MKSLKPNWPMKSNQKKVTSHCLSFRLHIWVNSGLTLTLYYRIQGPTNDPRHHSQCSELGVQSFCRPESKSRRGIGCSTRGSNWSRRWQTKWLVPWFDCDESLTCRGLNPNRGHFGCFTFIFILFGESCWLISWCAGNMCSVMGSNEDCGRSTRPGAEDREWSHRSDTWWPHNQEVGWSWVRSTPCTRRWGAWVCWLSLKTKVYGLSVVWAQNQWDNLLVVWPQNH
jgi:hypothetical protein